MERPDFLDDVMVDNIVVANARVRWIPLESGALMQLVFEDELGAEQRCRKMYVSDHATKSEVVLTVLKALITAVEHEAREMFTYRSQTIGSPHLDVDEWAANLPSPDVRT